MRTSKLNDKPKLMLDYVEKQNMKIPTIVKLVHGLSLADLVKMYLKLPMDCKLRDIIRMRLSRLNSYSWVKIIQLNCCTLNFVEMFSQYVCWSRVSKFIPLNDEAIVRLQDRIDFYNISLYQNLSEEIILMFADRLDWGRVCRKQKLTEKIINECIHLLCPYVVLKHQSLSERVMKRILQIEHINLIYALQYVVKYQRPLSHKFIVENYLVLPFFKLVKYQQLQKNTIRFIAEYYIRESNICEQEKHDLWHELVSEQNVTIQFCKRYSQYIDFNRLVQVKSLSENFLSEFLYDLDWKVVINSQKLSKQFLESLPKPFTSLSKSPKGGDTMCSVCLESIIIEPVLTNPCRHVFCKVCIESCLQVKRSCPLCRHTLVSICS